MGGGGGGPGWVQSLAANLGCYAALILPFWLALRCLRSSGALDSAQSAVEAGKASFLQRLICLIFAGRPRADLPTATAAGKSPERGGCLGDGALGLGFCFVGLMSMYLTWGLLQEKMMTRPYVRRDDSGQSDRFRDSQFLVFVNRAAGFSLAGLILLIKPGPPLRVPLYKLSYSSLSNILSSWCQYEALKHIIFPVQVLGKAFKIVPVMAMSTLISGAKYMRHEYASSLAISLGCGLFLYSQGSGGASAKKIGETLDIQGVILMTGYIGADAFTSNWQEKLKRAYGVEKMQLMCGVNLFSSILTLFALALQGSLLPAVSFVAGHEGMALDVLLLAVCGAIGQLFIFHTITRFGAVTFTIIMTIRQAAAIFLSCLWYGHDLPVSGIAGVLLVAAAVIAKAWLNKRSQAKAKSPAVKAIPSPDSVPLLRTTSI